MFHRLGSLELMDQNIQKLHSRFARKACLENHVTNLLLATSKIRTRITYLGTISLTISMRYTRLGFWTSARRVNSP